MAKVEAVLGRVTAARNRLAKVPPILKRFRQAVLAAACSGRLTEDWRQKNTNLESAETALERCRVATTEERAKNKRRKRETLGLPDVDLPEDLPDTWTLKTVKELIGNGALVDFQDGNHGELYPRTSDFGEKGVKFLTATQVFDNQVFLDDAPYLKREKAGQLRIGFAKPLDVLLTHNATVGRVAVLPPNCGEIILGTSVTYYRVNQGFLLPGYVCHAMQGKLWQDQLNAVMEQTTRNQVSITKQVEFWLAVPPLPEQHEIVRRVDALFQRAGAIERRVAAATGRADKLTQAVLAMAFRGELVPTEAELARAEGREYEPAAALLERVRAEREEPGGARSSPKRKSAAHR